MHLTEVRINPSRRYATADDPSFGFDVQVGVDEAGSFSAEFLGETYHADSLSELKRHLLDAALSARYEVPFVSQGGRRGVIRGWHAGTRDFLITWEGGHKDKLSSYQRVWKPEEISDETIARIEQLGLEIAERQQELAELQKPPHKVDDLFTEVFGEDITDHTRRQD
jgi:hypothetical protein